MKDFILKKLKEKSTWAGLAALVASLTIIPHAAEVSLTVSAVGGAIAAVIGIWFPETEVTKGE